MCESHISMIVRTHELSLTVLTQKLTKLCLEVTTSIEHLVDTNIYSKMPQIEKLAAAESPATIVQFGKLAWNTHRAINQRRGHWVDERKRKDHRWNDRLSVEIPLFVSQLN